KKGEALLQEPPRPSILPLELRQYSETVERLTHSGPIADRLEERPALVRIGPDCWPVPLEAGQMGRGEKRPGPHCRTGSARGARPPRPPPAPGAPPPPPPPTPNTTTTPLPPPPPPRHCPRRPATIPTPRAGCHARSPVVPTGPRSPRPGCAPPGPRTSRNVAR